MGYVTREMIDRAKKMDLLTYLQTYEPQELVHFGGNTYCTREHDSLKISNGKWCWFSRGIGGKTALDYLIKVKELPFTEAVERIVGRAAERPYWAEKIQISLDIPTLLRMSQLDLARTLTENIVKNGYFQDIATGRNAAFTTGRSSWGLLYLIFA